MSNPWGNIGAWAADAEQAEAEEREQQAAAEAAGSHTSGDPQSYPSLREAAAAKPKKKKATPIPLSEFNTGNYGVPGRRDQLLEPKGLTPDEMLRLPTRPKERSAEEMEQGRLGGGFRSYGRSGPSVGRRGDDSEGSWGGGGRRSNGGFDDERRGPPSRASDLDQPSRADEVDNWATGKKPAAFASTDSGRSERYGSLGGGGGSGSRADEVDSWATGKKPVQTRMSSFGSGFRDSASDSDRWSRGGSRDGDRERPKLVLDPPRGGELASNEPAKPRASPFGVARPREEVLAEKGLDWKKLDSEKTSRPSSSQSSRQGSPPLVAEAALRSRAKVNPFGDAKPREVLLQEKGKDWRKIDLELEHRSVDRPETEDEKMLKEEINYLKELMKGAEVNANGELVPGAAEERATLHEQILTKERDLEMLICDLNSKVRFGQRAASDRPSSGAGRIASFPDRPPSQSGMPDEPRSMEFMERPRSRGSDVWTRSGDDRKSFQSGRERGFFANRDMDRSNSRERW
ncbi:eukaryotic translation initiation factor 4B2-like protein [Cinnamomum micranthum f. kanehirae]|uniref:Eukaryotic translation initiation factor 4B2-like protein n=1 Tax=Cinnamomum micranthum f. kanehirae TaxID=337451 RepID=A0A443Q202_9MAGN|nr:eukaryotic translation initiation factor 4B2-like protein [Cinnamomum micranthum f. kanehirae]